MKHQTYLRCGILLFLLYFGAGVISAQTTEFTYQGKLTDTAGTAASYDFEFRLCGSATNCTGSMLYGTLTKLDVPVANGVFTVQLDFESGFSGGTRFLEISVKPAGSGGTFTLLAPRQPINSAPYAVRAVTATNSTQLGGIAANQFVQTGDSRLTDARIPIAGSQNYIQNTTEFQQFAGFDIGGSGRIRGDLKVDGILTAQLPPNNPNYIQNRASQQSLSNFNISGSGTVGGNLTVGGTLNANLPAGDASYLQNRTTTQSGTTNFNISGNGTLGGTLFAPTVSGNIINGTIIDSTMYRIGNQNILTNFGTRNLFAGITAGNEGTDNSFFGYNAGNANLATGIDNSFFGSDAGGVNTSGSGNSFFGSDTGDSNTFGNENSFFGRSAGSANVGGDGNAFFGFNSGLMSTANFNSFFGSNSGLSTTFGSSNSFFGYIAGGANTTGAGNSFFGKNAGDSNLGGNNNSFVGLLSGAANTTGSNNTFVGLQAGDTNTTGSNNTVLGASADVAANNLTYATAIGAGTVVSSNNRIQLGRTAGSEDVEIPGRTYSRQRLEVGTSSDDSSLFVYGFTSITGNLNVGGGAAISGNLSKGGGSFKIDHPLDPQNKYLYHSFVESPDMMNIYNGNAVTDAGGEVTVTLPVYFEALNREFRYQLTVIGVFAQAIVAEEIKGNQFKIRTDKPGVKVSWQVTGIRQDPYAEKNRIPTEVEKPENERGKYLYPQVYEQPADKPKK